MLDRPQDFGLDGADEADADPFADSSTPGRTLLPPTGVHPMVIKIAMSAVAWFLAVTWISFADGVEVDIALTVMTGFFVMFFTLFLLSASMIVDDRRWKQRKDSFRSFLEDEVAIDSDTMRGRDVLIYIALLPVTLAVGGTLIGLIWMFVRLGS